MSAWVLIVLAVHVGGAAMATATFETQEACEAAAAKWRKDPRDMNNSWAKTSNRYGVKALCHPSK